MVFYAKIWQATKNGTKYITVPKRGELKKGDYVRVEKVSDGMEEN